MSKLLIDSTPDRGEFWADQNYNVVTIDVLRATSTIAVALMKGAEKIIPCAEIDEAEAYKNRIGYILAGERKGEIIPGFDYTNSPYDLSKTDLKGKSLVLTTSDGTKLIKKAASAKHELVASTLNYGVIAQAILGIGGDWAIIGAGSSGDFRPEDKVGCALVAKDVIENGEYTVSEDDKNFIDTFSKNWEGHILGSLSVEKLRKIGRDVDIDFVIDEANNYVDVPTVQKVGDNISITLYESKN